MRSLLVVMIVGCAAPLAAADPFSALSIPSALPRDSILRVRVAPKSRRTKPLSVSSRPSAATMRPLVRLISDDDQAGIAYIGSDSDSQPDSQAELPSPPPPLQAPDDDSVISREALQGKAVPLDGAADTAESDSDETKTSAATRRGSFAWIAGTGNQLGILEWVERDLAVLDYSAAVDYSDETRASFRLNGGHAFSWLTGPNTTDLPPYLFSLFVEVGAGIKAGDDWSLDVVVSPSWNTDFANKSYQLFRLPWQAVNSFKIDEEWKLVTGITDLDREDIKLLPVVGMIYRPLDGSKDFSLVFPRPKAAWRLSRAEDGRHWGFISGELGGNSYSIQRPGAIHDIVTLRDYRLLVGWEKRGDKRHAFRIEAGWVFGRAVEYASGIGNYNPGQTAIIRLASDY